MLCTGANCCCAAWHQSGQHLQFHTHTALQCAAAIASRHHRTGGAVYGGGVRPAGMAAETRVHVPVALVVLGCSCFLWLCTEGILDCPPQCSSISVIPVCILGRRGVVTALLCLQHPTAQSAVAVAEERRCVVVSQPSVCCVTQEGQHRKQVAAGKADAWAETLWHRRQHALSAVCASQVMGTAGSVLPGWA